MRSVCQAVNGCGTVALRDGSVGAVSSKRGSRPRTTKSVWTVTKRIRSRLWGLRSLAEGKEPSGSPSELGGQSPCPPLSASPIPCVRQLHLSTGSLKLADCDGHWSQLGRRTMADWQYLGRIRRSLRHHPSSNHVRLRPAGFCKAGDDR